MHCVITFTVINGSKPQITEVEHFGACLGLHTIHSLSHQQIVLALIDHEVVHPSTTLEHVVFEYANDFPVVHHRYTLR